MLIDTNSLELTLAMQHSGEPFIRNVHYWKSVLALSQKSEQTTSNMYASSLTNFDNGMSSLFHFSMLFDKMKVRSFSIGHAENVVLP